MANFISSESINWVEDVDREEQMSREKLEKEQTGMRFIFGRCSLNSIILIKSVFKSTIFGNLKVSVVIFTHLKKWVFFKKWISQKKQVVFWRKMFYHFPNDSFFRNLKKESCISAQILPKATRFLEIVKNFFQNDFWQISFSLKKHSFFETRKIESWSLR